MHANIRVDQAAFWLYEARQALPESRATAHEAVAVRVAAGTLGGTGLEIRAQFKVRVLFSNPTQFCVLCLAAVCTVYMVILRDFHQAREVLSEIRAATREALIVRAAAGTLCGAGLDSKFVLNSRCGALDTLYVSALSQ